MIAILSRDPELYSTRSLQFAFEQAGQEVRVFDALSLEVKVGRGVYSGGEKVTPSLIIPRFSSQILVAGLAVLREWEAADIPVINCLLYTSDAADE